MQLINYLQGKIPALVIFVLALGLTSCGSYQYVGQSTDGIYGEGDNRQVQVAPEKKQEANNNDYYKNYFREKALEIESSEEGEVFIDIDSYQGNYSNENAQEESYAGWGENGNDVTVNIYDNGWGFYNNWNRPFWGWNRWGWNRWGWNAGFGYGGFGWNSGFYDPFWCPPYYGYGYGNGYYGNYGYYRNRANGRRGIMNGRYFSNRRVSAINRNNSIRRSRTRSTINRSNLTRRSRIRSSSNNATTRPQIKRPRIKRNNNSSTVRPGRSTTPRTIRSTPRRNNSYNPSRRSSGSTRGSRPSSRGGRRR